MGEVYYFVLYVHTFRHLKLEIALAIPASNDEKYKQMFQQDKGRVTPGLKVIMYIKIEGGSLKLGLKLTDGDMGYI